MATIFDDAGMDELARSPQIAAVVMKVAEKIAATARSTAPVDSGEYRGSIKTRLKYQERAVGVVYSDDPKALVIEAQTGNLARAAKMSARKR